MNEARIKTVLVAGAGSIGTGVARSFAKSGFSTQVLSRNPARLQGLLGDVEIVDKLPDTAPDLVVESVPEIAELKARLYRELEDAYGGAPILASNTSGLPLQDLARGLRYPHQFLGTHYLYPADSSEFVEVMRTDATGDAAVERVVAALRQCEKTPVALNRPVIGGLINRLQHALLHEAYFLIDEGIASAEQIDDIARRFLAPRMCITGLLMQKDISGLDTHALAQRTIVPHLCHDKTPSKTLQALYEQGHLGLKTGKGFYDWSHADAARVRSAATDKVAKITALMKQLESIPDAK
jgi:3-hydroxybutyryl-CoA dehydrogenase